MKAFAEEEYSARAAAREAAREVAREAEREAARAAARPFGQVKRIFSKVGNMHCQLDHMTGEQHATDYRQRNVFRLTIPMSQIHLHEWTALSAASSDETLSSESETGSRRQ